MSKVLSSVTVGPRIDALITAYIYYNETLFVSVFFNVDVALYNSTIEAHFLANQYD